MTTPTAVADPVGVALGSQPPLSATTTSLPSQRHLPVLDGMRGVAILLVLAHHFLVVEGGTFSEQVFFQLTEAGWTGVDLFFVLSGFLITGILVDSKNLSSYYKTFYIRRALRIFPLYIIF